MSRASKTTGKPYRVIGAYDSETSNVVDGARKRAFPILHQLGLIDLPIEQVTADNVEEHTGIHLYRHTEDLYRALDVLAAPKDYVPVICCHNLAFDMYGLAPWLNAHDVKVLAKSQRKPITFTILDDGGNDALVIWDTLVFAQKSLGYMGEECGYPKLSGDWDYDLVRTPETPLTDMEIAYAKHDVYALLSWLGYWCRLNPDINPEELGKRVVTKTGVVRRRRLQRFGKLRAPKLQRRVKDYWKIVNKRNMMHDDTELFTCNAATRGGFTFCASENASRVFDLDAASGAKVYGYDATSQHPSQIVSHYYPVDFKPATKKTLQSSIELVQMRDVDYVLSHYSEPFGVAFYGRFRFTNLRLKPGTPFGDFGIAPLASARCVDYTPGEYQEENADSEEFRAYITAHGYRDKVHNGVFAFGKLESCDECELYLTELAAWEVAQAYDFDSVEAIDGYATFKFNRPTDLTVISVMQFYAAKNEFKKARGYYYANEPIENADMCKKLNIPAFVLDGMAAHTIDDQVVESTYLGLKADLNALFGIEACNEYRRNTVLDDVDGITYEGGFGIENAPKNPKAWYQCGQRIVGWSRIAQCIVMMLAYPYARTIVNGDTDSVKIVMDASGVARFDAKLRIMDDAIDRAKSKVCARVRTCYPRMFDALDGIGYYVHEFEVTRFCASWNKAYAVCEHDPRDDADHVRFTLAGIPASRGANQLADRLLADGAAFGDITDIFLGYNVNYTNDITGLNARSFPRWGEVYDATVTDYRGCAAHVSEPAALALYPMAKVVNDTRNADNARNLARAKRNRPSVNTASIMIMHDEIIDVRKMLND